MTKNIQVSLRLTPYQLAHGLEIIQSLEPSYHPVSLSAMVKLIVNDYLAKMSVVSNPWPSERAIQEINQLRKDKNPLETDQEKTSSDDLIFQKILESKNIQEIKEVKQTKEVKTPTYEIDYADIEARVMVNMQKDTVKTKSIKTIVTDFSPPNFEELLNEENE